METFTNFEDYWTRSGSRMQASSHEERARHAWDACKRKNAGWTPLSLAQHFHNLYERAAPEFGYETRTETRAFNPESANGMLMIAVCREILHDLTK